MAAKAPLIQVDKTLHIIRASTFSKLSLIFHSKFNLKGFPVTCKYLVTSVSIPASRAN